VTCKDTGWLGRNSRFCSKFFILKKPGHFTLRLRAVSARKAFRFPMATPYNQYAC
jgi:hypothetical protein